MFWDLIVVGRGSAAAYYLSTVDRTMFPNILVIGTPDPWAEERGYNNNDQNDTINFINHTWQMIEHLSDIFPDFDKDLVDRRRFAEANSKVIDSCSTQIFRAKVTNIEEILQSAAPEHLQVHHYGAVKIFKVSTDMAVAFYGKKIVVATGAGPHRVPDEVKGLVSDKIMDMDMFGRLAGTFPNPQKLTVFVLGPNAAIDSVETAKFQKFNVVWLVKKSNKPAILATGHQIYALDAKKNDVVEYPDHDRGTKGFDVELVPGTPQQMKVKIKGEEDMVGDLFVYGMGQNPKDATKGVVPDEFMSRLQPIYDIDQRFGAAHETVLGLKLENTDWNTGFEVIGALATQVARGAKVQHTYKKELATRIEEVRAKVLPFLTGALVHRQTEILTMDLKEIEKMSPGMARGELKTARSWVEGRYPSWKNHVNALTAMMLNYVTVAQYFAKKLNVEDADLSAAARILTPSVIQGPQLGVIRSQATALNSAVPGYIGKQAGVFNKEPGKKPVCQGALTVTQSGGNHANFSGDDPQVLRLYIAVNFPYVSEEEAERFIKQVLQRRGDIEKLGGYGYGPADSQRFEQELQSMNTRNCAALVSPKTYGSGVTANNFQN
jgi:hypothetical protein